MESIFNNIESAASVLLKSFLILASIFVLGVSFLIIKDAILFSNSIARLITIVLTISIWLISVLSSICFYKKIK